MVHISAVSTVLALAVAVSGYVVPRQDAPAGWVTAIMEPYGTYHTRYVALSCQTQHGTAFFDACCHPLKSNETLATARPAECDPSNVSMSLSATASASAPAATESSSPDDDCEDDSGDNSGDDSDDDSGDDCDESSVVAETSTPSIPEVASSAVAKAVPTTTAAPAPVTTTSTPKTSSKPDTVSKPETTVAPTSTPKPTPTTTQKTSTKAQATATSSSSSSSSGLITGGQATFYDQEGGTGSCGNVFPDTAKIVAVQIDRMNSSLCGKSVEITNTANGKTVTATVQDTCPGCDGSNSLDLSHGAFDAIGDEATGVLPISWRFLD